MNPFEAYKLFMGIKMHFTTPKYDFIKYNGKSNANIQTFERRRDKWHFAKLAKHKDPMGYLIALFSSGIDIKWGGDLFSDGNDELYTDWLQRQQSLTYRFKSDVKLFEDRFVEVFKCREGQHPELLSLVKRNAISFESFTILNDQLDFFPIWDKKIMDPVIWPSIRNRALKYRPFINYDRPKIKLYIRSVIAETTAK